MPAITERELRARFGARKPKKTHNAAWLKKHGFTNGLWRLLSLSKDERREAAKAAKKTRT